MRREDTPRALPQQAALARVEGSVDELTLARTPYSFDIVQSLEVKSITLGELARRLGAELTHAASDSKASATEISGCAPIGGAGPNEVTFLANKAYTRYLSETRAAAVLMRADVECPEGVVGLVCDDPYFAFRNAMVELHGFRRHPAVMRAPAGPAMISDHASVHPTAAIGDGAQIHPNAVVENSARVGRNSVLYPGVYVGEGATVGDDCILYANVVIYDRCMLGDRVTLHSNTVIGQDGFGYATHAGAHHKIPQTGTVVLEDDVEMGAGCAIERAAMGETRIRRGTKFADLISIGHGTTIGEHCLFVSFVGVSGSVDIGNYVVLGGQTVVAGHIRVGNGVQAIGRTAIAQDVEDGQIVGGVPAIPMTQAKKNALVATDLYGLFQRVRRIEKRLAKADSAS